MSERDRCADAIGDGGRQHDWRSIDFRNVVSAPFGVISKIVPPPLAPP